MVISSELTCKKTSTHTSLKNFNTHTSLKNFNTHVFNTRLDRFLSVLTVKFARDKVIAVQIFCCHTQMSEDTSYSGWCSSTSDDPSCRIECGPTIICPKFGCKSYDPSSCDDLSVDYPRHHRSYSSSSDTCEPRHTLDSIVHSLADSEAPSCNPFYGIAKDRKRKMKKAIEHILSDESSMQYENLEQNPLQTRLQEQNQELQSAYTLVQQLQSIILANNNNLLTGLFQDEPQEEAQADIEPQREAEDQSEAEPEPEVEEEAEVKAQAEAQADPEPEVEEEAQAETQAEVEEETQAEVEAETQAEVEEEAQAEVEEEAEPEVETEASDIVVIAEDVVPQQDNVNASFDDSVVDVHSEREKMLIFSFLPKQGHQWAHYNNGAESIHVNGKNGPVNGPVLHLYMDRSYIISVDQDVSQPEADHYLVFTDNPMGGPGSRIIHGGFDPIARGSVRLTIDERTPKYFYYQCTRYSYAGGLVIVHSSSV